MSTTYPVPIEEAQAGERPGERSDAELVSFYRDMSRIRAFEDAVVEAFSRGLIPGSTHPCIGQEASKVGTIRAAEERDLVLATYRGHGEALLKGVDPVAMMAELMGRTTGINKGKGGSMHLADPEHGLMTTNAIVAGHIPHAGGVALSCQVRKTGQVVLCYFGDGASCEGEFFETLNMAQLWRVPLVFVCENNGFAISVPTSKSQATPDIADRARGFGMPATIVDGNDVIAVHRAAREAIDHARRGDGPWFLECKTRRWERHSAFSAGGSDPSEARRAWQSVDPIPRYRKALAAWGLADDGALDAIDAENRDWAAQVTAEAEKAPHPGPESVFEDVYAPASA